MQILLFILALVLFYGLVIIHEYGHYKVAKRNGVESEEFGLGFPPRAWSKRLESGLLLSLNWLPLGGFVKMKGESDSDKRAGSFGAASTWAKTKILLAGVAMNVVAGLGILTILALIGLPVLITKDYNGVDQFTVKSDTKVISQEVLAGTILKGSPADRAGLRNTDTIESISGNNGVRQIDSTTALHATTAEFAGQKVTITYKRQGQIQTKQVQLLSAAEVEASLKTNNPKGNLGVVSNDIQLRRSTWSAPIVALGFTGQLAKLSVLGIGHSLAGLGSAIAGGVTGNHQARENGQTKATEQTGGPVAIAQLLWSSGSLGLNFIFMIIAIVSLSLAVMNVLPVPALDGGRLLMILVSRLVLKKPLAKSTEEKIVTVSFIALLILIVLITIVDVKRSF